MGSLRSVAHPITVTAVEEDLSIHPTRPNTRFPGPVSGLQSIPRRFLITGTLFAMGKKGQLKALFGLNRGLVLFVARPDCDSTAVSTM